MKHQAGLRRILAALTAVAPALIILVGQSAQAAPQLTRSVTTSPTYSGFVYNSAQSASTVTNTFTVPAITCTATDQGIIPGVAIPDDKNTNIIAAGVAETCQSGHPAYHGEADINGTTTVFHVTVKPNDVVTTTLKASAKQTTGTFQLTVPGKPPVTISFHGTGGNNFFPCLGIDSLQGSPNTNPVPRFPQVTFKKAMIDGKPVSAKTTTRINMETSGGVLQIATSLLANNGTSYSMKFVNNG